MASNCYHNEGNRGQFYNTIDDHHQHFDHGYDPEPNESIYSANQRYDTFEEEHYYRKPTKPVKYIQKTFDDDMSESSDNTSSQFNVK